MENQENLTNENAQTIITGRGVCRNLAARVPITVYDEIYKIAVEKNMTVTDVTIILLKGALKFMKNN